MRPFFPERRLKLLRLDYNNDAAGMIDFVDEQIEMEKACDELIGRLRRRRRDSDDNIDVGEEAAKRHVLRFRDAVDVALNCLAMRESEPKRGSKTERQDSFATVIAAERTTDDGIIVDVTHAWQQPKLTENERKLQKM